MDSMTTPLSGETAHAAEDGHLRQMHVISPARGWSALGLRDVWEYRELLWFHILRNVKGRYRQTALGWLWIALNPLMSMVLFSVLFGKIAKLPSDGVPYPVFTYAGILPWAYFSTSTVAATGSLASQMGVISKVYFPRLLVPISSVTTALVDFMFSFAILMGMMAWFALSPSSPGLTVSLSPSILLLPVYLLFAGVTALSIGLWCATLKVRFRDIGNVIGFVLRAWMYLTPVAYTSKLIPDRWLLLYRINPMYWVVEGFRWSLLDKGQPPEPLMLVPVAIVGLLTLSGLYVFRRTEQNIVDLL